MKEIKTINDVQEFLREIPDINTGGCGIAALAIARWVHVNLNASCLFLLGQFFQETYAQNTKAEINRKNKPTSAAHIGVLVFDYEVDRQYVIDSDGTFNALRYNYINTVDQDFLLRSINQCDSWNDLFKRIYVQKIAEALDIDLSDIDLRSGYEFKNGVKPIFYNKSSETETETSDSAISDAAGLIDFMQTLYSFS